MFRVPYSPTPAQICKAFSTKQQSSYCPTKRAGELCGLFSAAGTPLFVQASFHTHDHETPGARGEGMSARHKADLFRQVLSPFQPRIQPKRKRRRASADRPRCRSFWRPRGQWLRGRCSCCWPAPSRSPRRAEGCVVDPFLGAASFSGPGNMISEVFSLLSPFWLWLAKKNHHEANQPASPQLQPTSHSPTSGRFEGKPGT